jgi:CheY-like chemotaxis protein
MNALRVLVIDDSADAVRTLATLISLWGHEVRYAFDGPSGLALAEAFHPDVAFCDIAMPGMDGCEVARRIRLSPTLATAFVVAVTAYGSEQDRRNTRGAGFELHLVKPVEPEHLKSILGNRPQLPLELTATGLPYPAQLAPVILSRREN